MSEQRPPPYDGLYNTLVRRLRAADTIFKDKIKLILRPAEEPGSLLTLPYLLVVPTVTRIEGGAARTARDQPVESIVNPRSVTFQAQLDGRGSEMEWRAAIDMEIVERQLISTLVNWRPAPWFRPTAYAGMRFEPPGARLRGVKAAFVFTFFEELFLADDLPPEECAALGFPMEFPNFIVSPGPPPQADPCADPCNPCAPDEQWTPDAWIDLKAKGDDE
jgi:hypothetical protein